MKAGLRLATNAIWILFAWIVLSYADSWLLLPYDCADLGFVISYSKWDCSGPDVAGAAPMRFWQHAGFLHSILAFVAAVIATLVCRRYRWARE